MTTVLVRSVFDAFEYVLEHYYCPGMEDEDGPKDTYAVISIQDAASEGFGVRFTESRYCKGVLTLLFDDADDDCCGAVLFNDEMAEQIIDFILEYRDKADTLLVHCYAGQSRSMAVGAFAHKLLGGDNKHYFTSASPNMFVYKLLDKAWFRRRFTPRPKSE